MKTTIVLHDVYCDVTYPEYLTSAIDITKTLRPLNVLKLSFFSICLLFFLKMQ